jgi:hypothetical protein
MLQPASAAPVTPSGPRLAYGSNGQRASIRVDVPERLLRMTRFGLDFAAHEGSGWWRRVESEMQNLIDSHLPSQAAEVEMNLDVDRLEVVLSYRVTAATGDSPVRVA